MSSAPPIQVTLNFENYEELATFAVAMAANKVTPLPTPVVTTTVETKPGKPKADKPAASSPQAANPSAPPVAAPSNAPTPVAASAPAQPTTPVATPAASNSLRDKKYAETGIGEMVAKFNAADKANRAVLVKVCQSIDPDAKNERGPFFGAMKPEFFDTAFAALKALVDGVNPDTVLAGLAGDDGNLG